MPIKIKNIELAPIMGGLADLSAKELPVEFAFKVMRNTRKTAEALGDYRKTKNSILDKFASGTDQGGVAKFKDDKAKQKAEKACRELLELEVEIEYDLISEAELKALGSLKPVTLTALEKIIKQ